MGGSQLAVGEGRETGRRIGESKEGGDRVSRGRGGVREGILFLCLVWIHLLLFCFFFQKSNF